MTITTEDHQAIMQAISCYGHRFDGGDAAGFASLYTPEGTWCAHPNKSPEPVVVLKGRQEIQMFADNRQRMFAQQGVETRHCMMGVVIDVQSATRVEASAMAIILWQRPTRGDPLPRPVQSGYYTFSLSKTGEGWRYDRVEVHTSGLYKPEEVYTTKN